MNTSLKQFLERNVLFVILLPILWVLHGYTNNLGLVPKKDTLLLALFYCSVALILTGILWLFYRNIFKAALLTFLLLSLQFLFGPVHDFLKGSFPGTIIVKYSFLLPLLLLLVITASIYLKRSKNNFHRMTIYLNTLFFVLITLDSFSLAISRPKEQNTNAVFNFTPCDSCQKPDIYLIVADGYPGNRQLRDLFDFDNSNFENTLKQKGFFIVDSSMSNYNFTQYSIASMLSLNYLKGIKHINSNKDDIQISHNALKNSPVISYFQNEGYTFFNHSIFDFKGQPSITIPTFLTRKLEPITRQTLTYRIMKDLGYHFVTTLKIPFLVKRQLTADKVNNQKIIAATQKTIHQKNNKQKFVYTHLMMPHHPFFYDSTGKEVPLELLKDEFFFDKGARISYLKYTNNVLLKLIDEILSYNKEKPVIFLISDHGIREIRDKFDPHYQFMNLNAVLLPDRDYDGLYKGMSNINFFRFFLNKQFRQNLPMLKDSTIFITD